MECLKLENLTRTHCHNKIAIMHVSQCEIIKQVTFGTLFEFVNEVKAFLLKHIEGNEDVCIGLLMDKNVYLPAIIICFQELNYCFVFLTLKMLGATVNNLNIKWIISFDINNPLGEDIFLKGSLKLSAAEEGLQLWINGNFIMHRTRHLFNDIFCVVQTSGSTGENKIVHVPHSCIENNVLSLNKHLGVTSKDVIYWGTPLTFDPALVEFIVGVSNQATLVIVSKLVALNPALLYRALFKIGLTSFLQVVPSIFLRWNKQQISEILLKSSLKVLAFGGESFPLEVLKYKRQPHLRLFNLYGVTELSCWATVADVTSRTGMENDEVPLGVTLDDTFIEVKNDNDQLISQGVGEISIASNTRRCFINDNNHSRLPFEVKTGDLGEWKNGNLYYRGRKTRVIKRFGHRLALHKMENTICNETGLQSRLVYSKINNKLLAFVLIEETFDTSTKQKLLDKLRVKLLNVLPEHGFPDFVDVLTHFPLQAHGKICDKSLQRRYEDTLSEAPSKPNPGDIFRNTLSNFLRTDNIEQLGAHTFYELGGNSISAIQLLKMFEERVGTENSGQLLTLLLNESVHTCLDYVTQNVTLKRKYIGRNSDGKEPKSLRVERGQRDCVAWKYDLKGCVDSAPVAFKIDSKTYVAAGSFAHILAIVQQNGEEYLRLVLPQEIEGQPRLSKCGTFLLVGCSNGVMYSINLISKQIAWQFPALQKIKSAALVRGTSVIFGSYDECVYCLAVEDGTLRWKTRLSGSIKADLANNEDLGLLFIGTIRGMCYALNDQSGDVLWSYKVDGPIFGSPCVIGECIVWPSVIGKIYCTSSNGALKWSIAVAGHIFSSLIVNENAIYFGCHDSYLYKIAISATAGELSKIAKLESETSTSPFLYHYEGKTFLIAVCNVGVLYVVDDGSNKVIFKMKLPAESFSSPFVFDKKVYVGCRDNHLYCINIEKCLIK